jgi:hypothetical protein
MGGSPGGVHGFMALTFLCMHKSMPTLLGSLCSKGMAQRMIVIILPAQCGPYHNTVTTITTASDHPGTHLIPLITARMTNHSRPIYKVLWTIIAAMLHRLFPLPLQKMFPFPLTREILFERAPNQ